MSHNLGFDRTGLDMPLVQRCLPARREALCFLRIKLCKEGARAYGLHAVWIQMGSFGVHRLYTSVCRERSELRAHAGAPEASPPPQNAEAFSVPHLLPSPIFPLICSLRTIRGVSVLTGSRNLRIAVVFVSGASALIFVSWVGTSDCVSPSWQRRQSISEIQFWVMGGGHAVCGLRDWLA